MKNNKIMPTTYFFLAIVLMLILHFIFPVIQIVPRFWHLLGIIPIALGIIINLLADNAFNRAYTTVKPFQESSTLITNGVFAITRNPMYLGFVLILMGIAVLLRSLTPFVLVIAFAVLMNRMYILIEEGMLAEKFGSEWRSYRQHVRRWL